MVIGYAGVAIVRASAFDLLATPETFAAQVAAATAGQTIGLASGDYGTFAGANKAITIKALPGATCQMAFNFGTGDAGFTIDGMVNCSGTIAGNAANITIQNCVFVDEISIDSTGAGILLYRTTHNNIGGSTTAHRILINSACILREAHLEGGGSDGVRLGAPVTFGDVIIEDCVFLNINDDGSGNHTDMIQWFGGTNTIVRRNLFKQTINLETQVMGQFNEGGGHLIEHNVIDVLARPWGIELYSDDSSIVRHNTLIYYEGTAAFGLDAGSITLDHKVGEPGGVGTEVYNNVCHSVDINGDSVAAVNTNNMLTSGAAGGNFNGAPSFVGGASPSTWAGYALAAGSPGITGAIDGGPVGIRPN